MTPADFYYAALKYNGSDVSPPDLAKVAEARGVSVKLAERAKAVYDQLLIDGVKYASSEARLDDAFKIAYAATATGAELPTFYENTLKMHGVSIVREDLSKVASVHGDDIAKIAKAFYDQLTADAQFVPGARAGIALKMASGYVKQAQDSYQQNLDFAQHVHTELAKTASAVCQAYGLEETGDQLIAALTGTNDVHFPVWSGDTTGLGGLGL